MYTPTIPLKDLVHVEFSDALSITEQLKKALTLACSDGNMNKNKYKNLSQFQIHTNVINKSY